MRKVSAFLVIVAVFCLLTPWGVAAKNNNGHGGNPGGDGGGKTTTQSCQMTGAVSSNGESVVVGTDVGTYGGEISLFLSASVLSGADGVVGKVAEGDYFGPARVLKAKTSSRLDFFFSADGGCNGGLDATRPCDYRLILQGGLYSRHDDEVTFKPGGGGATVTLLDLNQGAAYVLSEEPLKNEVTITFEP